MNCALMMNNGSTLCYSSIGFITFNQNDHISIRDVSK